MLTASELTSSVVIVLEGSDRAYVFTVYVCVCVCQVSECESQVNCVKPHK